jgi:hypothetical protein
LPSASAGRSDGSHPASRGQSAARCQRAAQPGRAGSASLIRTEDEMDRNVGESQPLIRFLSGACQPVRVVTLVLLLFPAVWQGLGQLPVQHRHAGRLCQLRGAVSSAGRGVLVSWAGRVCQLGGAAAVLLLTNVTPSCCGRCSTASPPGPLSSPSRAAASSARLAAAQPCPGVSILNISCQE